MHITGAGIVRDTIDVWRSNVPRADAVRSGLPRSPIVAWAVTGMPISIAASQNASSSGAGEHLPLGNDDIATERSPIDLARLSSPIAFSMPLAGMMALPMRRSGATAQ